LTIAHLGSARYKFTGTLPSLKKCDYIVDLIISGDACTNEYINSYILDPPTLNLDPAPYLYDINSPSLLRLFNITYVLSNPTICPLSFELKNRILNAAAPSDFIISDSVAPGMLSAYSTTNNPTYVGIH
jgi:hypothetical protein